MTLLKRLLKKPNDNSKSENREEDDKSKDKYVHTFGKEDDKRIIMLLSSLHVSETGSKHWLDAALKYLVDQWKEEQNIEAKSYLKHMEDVATSFVFDRSLSPNSDLDYFSIIYENKGVCQMKKEELFEEHIKKWLSYVGGIPHRIFHFFDYLLWLKCKDDRNYPKIKILKEGNFPKITDFEFTTSNSSVERHSPRTRKKILDCDQKKHYIHLGIFV